MNIFNLRDRQVPVGKQQYSENEMRIDLPSAGKHVKTDMVKAIQMLTEDMQHIIEMGLDFSVNAQVIVDEEHWKLAIWMVEFLAYFDVTPIIVLQNNSLDFRAGILKLLKETQHE